MNSFCNLLAKERSSEPLTNLFAKIYPFEPPSKQLCYLFKKILFLWLALYVYQPLSLSLSLSKLYLSPIYSLSQSPTSFFLLETIGTLYHWTRLFLFVLVYQFWVHHSITHTYSIFIILHTLPQPSLSLSCVLSLSIEIVVYT